MKKIIVLIAIIASYYNSNAQFSKESQEIEDQYKYPRVNYLGTIDNHVYYAQFKEKHTDQVIISFNKINQSNMVIGNPIDISLNVTKDLIYKSLYNFINIYAKNGFVYIFYGLIDTKAKPTTYRLFMKVLDKNLKEINTQEFTTSIKEKYRFYGKYTVHFSNDEKKALVNIVYQSHSEITKDAKSELNWINLETNTLDEKYYLENSSARNLPIDPSYIISNNGNVAFIMRDIIDGTNNVDPTSILIGLIKYKSNKILRHKIEFTNQDTSINCSILSLKSERSVFLGITKSRYIYRYIDVENCTVTSEKSVSLKDEDMLTLKNRYSIEYATESSGNIYFSLSKFHRGEYGFTYNNEITILKTNINGDYSWIRTIPRKTGGIVESNLSSNNFELRDYKFMIINNSLNYCYVESRDNAPVKSGNKFSEASGPYIYEKIMDILFHSQY